MNKLVTLGVFFFLGGMYMAQAQEVYLSAHLSTQGPGIELKYQPRPGFNIRGGASVLPIKFNSSYTIRNEPADAKVNVDFANAHLMLDWHPFVNVESFSRKLLLNGGLAYFWDRQGDALARYRGTYNYEGMQVSAEEIGELYGTVEWKNIAPYLGLGFENPRPRNRVNVGFALGAYYMGKPEVNVTGTRFLADAEEDEREFRENVSGYRFLPVIQVNLNIRL